LSGKPDYIGATSRLKGNAMPTFSTASIQATLKQVAAAHGVQVTPPTIPQMVDTFFKTLDTNSNGGVSAVEVNALLPKGAPLAKLAAVVVFNAFDGNHDGSISKAELTAWAGTRDTNHDGTLQASELKADIVELIGVVFPHGIPGLHA
jgi:hypothetical protein